MTSAHPDTATMISAHSPAPRKGEREMAGMARRAVRAGRARLSRAVTTPPPHPLPSAVLRACARHGVPPPRFVLVVSVPRQSVALFEKHPLRANGNLRHTLAKTFRCSTSKFGVGETSGSFMTPRGLHRVAEKIGGGWPVGTAFQGRKPVGFTWRGKPAATITSRIFWLEGLEPGFNRGGRVDSHSRHIYIHGTGNEPALGRPDSHGCVHLAADDLIPLYDKLPAGTLVWMAP